MNIVTKLFGEIAVSGDKIINFSSGLIGFDAYKQFMIIHDSEAEDAKILWLQSLDEPELALPIISPLNIDENYNPVVEDELFKNIGETDEEMLVFVTLTVPGDITKMTANLKAPIIINPTTQKGCQIIVENDEYKIKQPVYDMMKKKAGE